MKDTTLKNIDFVVPYVDNTDQVWRDTFIRYCSMNNLKDKIVEMIGSRYGGITFIYDQLKLVNKNMPWIRNIYLLISNKEQVEMPKLPKNCKIVLHNQFIPQQFLPTFNSCTIEMFLWNIPDLSENFIYANDDMLPVGQMTRYDFFAYNGKIKIEWREDEFKDTMNVYGYQCQNNVVSICKALGKKYERMYRPVHSFTPMIKSHCKEAFKLLQKDIVPHIRAFRTRYQYNQYIYPLYERYMYGTEKCDIDFCYTELDKDFDLQHQIVCVNCEHKIEYIKKYQEEIRKLL